MERNPGKEICEQLRNLRKEFAAYNGLEYEFKECTHEGLCRGSCEFCEQEAAELERLAGKKQFEQFREIAYPRRSIKPIESPRLDDPRNMPCVRTPGLIVAPRDTVRDETPAPSKKKSAELKIPEFLQKNRKKS